MADQGCSPVSPDPDLEAELHLQAWYGLERADLAPLARLLRSGFGLDDHLASDIADAIEGTSTGCRISAGRPRRGKPAGDREALELRNGMIARFVARRMKPSAFESTVMEAMEFFGLSRTSVTEALLASETFRARIPPRSLTFWDKRCEDALDAYPGPSGAGTA